MFFCYPEKVYVIVGLFETTSGHLLYRWYLKDADTKARDITIRKWTMSSKKAVQFDRKEDAENVGLLILNEGEFVIESLTK